MVILFIRKTYFQILQKKAGVVTKVYHEYALFYMLLVCLSNIFPLCRDLECLFIAELRRRLVEFNAENNLMRTIYWEHASTLYLFFGIFFCRKPCRYGYRLYAYRAHVIYWLLVINNHMFWWRHSLQTNHMHLRNLYDNEQNADKERIYRITLDASKFYL